MTYDIHVITSIQTCNICTGCIVACIYSNCSSTFYSFNVHICMYESTLQVACSAWVLSSATSAAYNSKFLTYSCLLVHADFALNRILCQSLHVIWYYSIPNLGSNVPHSGLAKVNWQLMRIIYCKLPLRRSLVLIKMSTLLNY